MMLFKNLSIKNSFFAFVLLALTACEMPNKATRVSGVVVPAKVPIVIKIYENDYRIAQGIPNKDSGSFTVILPHAGKFIVKAFLEGSEEPVFVSEPLTIQKGMSVFIPPISIPTIKESRLSKSP